MYNIISWLCELHCNYTFCIKKDSKLLSSDLNVLSSVSSIIPLWNLIVRLEGSVLRRAVGSDWRFNAVSRIPLESQVTEDEFCSVSHNQQSFLGLLSSGISNSSEVCNSWVQTISYFLSTLFYVFLFQCSQGCDYCRDPDAVDELVEHWRRGATAGAYRSVSAGRTYIAYDTSSGDDTELYEGGKFAYRRE